MDAKKPDEEIASGENVEQAYSYAIHPDVRVSIYALCNGRQFVAFTIDIAKPLIHFHVSEIALHLERLYSLLSPSGFITQKSMVRERGEARDWGVSFDYANVTPLPEIKDLKKQSAKRHFGVHPYFTKQVWNVVQEYIKNFTRPGDTVLDPYGGSGVTLVEALILKRKAIQVDINPLANFIVHNLIQPIDIGELTRSYNSIKKQFLKNAPHTKAEIEEALQKYDYPKGLSSQVILTCRPWSVSSATANWLSWPISNTSSSR